MNMHKRLGRIGIPLALSALAFAGCALAQAVPTDVIINEVELNPPGFDIGAEWVELLNVGDAPVDVTGWTISYSYRGPGKLPLSEGPLTLAPGGRFVFVYPGLRLRNVGGTPIALYDAAGVLVAEGPSMTDRTDDDLTWQRIPDGGDPNWPDLWFLRKATRNAPNV